MSKYSNNPMDLAGQVTHALRWKKPVTVILTPDEKEARIVMDGRTLAYVHENSRGIKVHVQHYGREERLRVTSIAAAARAVKTSERREPRVKA
jgi:hypothetical protein